MNPSYQQIAELFGIDFPSEVDEPTDVNELLNRPATSQEIGQVRMMEGRYAEAIEQFRKVVEQTGGKSLEARLALAGAYEISDQAPQALLQYLKALRSHRENPEAHLAIGELYKRHGRANDAMDQVRTAISLEPENAYFRYKLAELLSSVHFRKAALQVIEQAIVLQPDSSFYYYWAANLLIDLKRYDDAIDSLRAAIELSPGDDFLYLRTAVAFWGAGRRSDAIVAARLASDLNPENQVAYALMEWMNREDNPELRSDPNRKKVLLDPYDGEQLLRLIRECSPI
jgi:tetratricopeptide (TPR) repeat protein